VRWRWLRLGRTVRVFSAQCGSREGEKREGDGFEHDGRKVERIRALAIGMMPGAVA
jgi:hypothetical protein